MVNIILFSIFGGILTLLVFGGLGMYISGEKGKSTTKGFFIGALLPLFGHIYLALQKTTTEVVVQEMYDRKLMDLKDYEKTMQIAIKKDGK